MAAEAPPSWWLLGPSCWKSINDQPVATSEALARLLAPPSQPLAPAAAAVTHTPAVVPAAPADAVLLRQRLEPPKFDVHEHSLRSERRRGIALRRREDIERKMHQEQMAEVQARQRVLAEAQAAQIAAREAELRTAAEEAEKAAASSSSKKQKKEEAAAASASKRKSVAPLARVEVALNEDEMASWYQASIQQETKTRAKNMGGSGNDGEDEHLMIEGRKEEESIPKDCVRPLPPVDQSWTPTLNENCELLYLDGWWPVKVKKIEKGDKWHVMYEAFGVMHVVSRKQLRQAVRWDAESQSFKPDAK